jgi:hypothetical protein
VAIARAESPQFIETVELPAMNERECGAVREDLRAQGQPFAG